METQKGVTANAATHAAAVAADDEVLEDEPASRADIAGGARLHGVGSIAYVAL